MILQLLNIERYINENKLLEVKSYKIPFKSYDENGLWSEQIFGPLGSKTRSERFGYIDLKGRFIHPIVFNMLETVSDETSRIIKEKAKFIVRNHKYIEDINGETGISFLIRTLPEVKLASFCHSHKLENANYIDSHLNFILIDKFLVTPAANRDIDIHSNMNKREMEEINNLYIKLIVYVQQLIGIPDLDAITNKKIQLQLNALISYIKKTKLTGKKGLFRGTMLKKSMDYSTRLVLTNDPNIKLGTIGLPWHTLVAIFEPFVMHYLFKKEQNLEIKLNLQSYTNSEDFNYNNFSKFVKDLVVNPDIVPLNIKSGLISVLNQFLPEQIVMCKRDPVVQRKSWFSAVPVITEGRVAYVNSMDLGPLGGDCVKGFIVTFVKNHKDLYMQRIESIDTFYKNHNLSLIEKRIVNGKEIYDFLVNDEIYSLGMNEKNGRLQYSRIQRWSVHNNIKLNQMLINDIPIIISKDNSCFVYNELDSAYEKLSVSDVNNNANYSFIKVDFELDGLLNKKYRTSKVNSTNVHFIKEYVNTNKVHIKINETEIETTEDKVGYDLTMADSYVRSFLHTSMILQCNSDGDTVAVLPVFTNEAKEEIKNKMDPTKNKSKWKDLSSYNGVMYSPSLDAISTIYSATLQ
jgi:hypothetical protein